jgi:predicted Zn-dependent protease
VNARPLEIVSNGRLERFLCDRAGAAKLRGEPGRGRRAVWSRPPVSRLSNLVIDAGSVPPHTLENDLDRGLVVSRIGGAAVDPNSGRMVLRVERGWEIRSGKRRRSLAPCELTGGVLEVLASIDPRIGSDPTPDWRLGWCVKGGLPLATGSESPSMLVRRLEVL